jgi:DNA-binding MarR family transcriptional regulator
VSAAASIKGAKLPLPVKAVLLALALEVDGGSNAPSIPELCAIACCARSTVLDALAQLETMGYIERTRVPSKRTTYRITVPAADRPQPAPSVQQTVRKAPPKAPRVTAPSSGRLQ